MIFLWGLLTDAPMAAVHEELSSRGASFFFLDQRRTDEARLQLSINGGVAGWLRVGNDEIQLESVSAAYFRPYDLSEVDVLKRIPRDTAEWSRMLQVERMLHVWLELAPILVVNRPSMMATNNSKPYQAEIIRRAGLAVPATLLTTSPSAVMDFSRHHERVIYKSISSIRSIVSELVPDDPIRLAEVTHCPTQFQERIAGDDVRVHVLGDEIFACRIVAPTADYRYSREARIERFELPDSVAAACLAVARELGLHFTGIDLRRTPDGAWFCFEANPSPGYSYFAAETGQPIARRLADYLCGAGHVVDGDEQCTSGSVIFKRGVPAAPRDD